MNSKKNILKLGVLLIIIRQVTSLPMTSERMWILRNRNARLLLDVSMSAKEKQLRCNIPHESPFWGVHLLSVIRMKKYLKFSVWISTQKADQAYGVSREKIHEA